MSSSTHLSAYSRNEPFKQTFTFMDSHPRDNYNPAPYKPHRYYNERPGQQGRRKGSKKYQSKHTRAEDVSTDYSNQETRSSSSEGRDKARRAFANFKVVVMGETVVDRTPKQPSAGWRSKKFAEQQHLTQADPQQMRPPRFL